MLKENGLSQSVGEFPNKLYMIDQIKLAVRKKINWILENKTSDSLYLEDVSDAAEKISEAIDFFTICRSEIVHLGFENTIGIANNITVSFDEQFNKKNLNYLQIRNNLINSIEWDYTKVGLYLLSEQMYQRNFPLEFHRYNVKDLFTQNENDTYDIFLIEVLDDLNQEYQRYISVQFFE